MRKIDYVEAYLNNHRSWHTMNEIAFGILNDTGVVINRKDVQNKLESLYRFGTVERSSKDGIRWKTTNRPGKLPPR